MSDSIKVFSPASIANVGPGYDAMGFALNDVGEHIIVRKNRSDKLTIKPLQGFPSVPTEPDKNVATVAVRAMLDAIDTKQGFEFEFIKNIKPGSGLGTSASSSVGAVFAVDMLLGGPCSRNELLQFATQGEKYLSGKAHADNVAPALMGGFQLIRGCVPLDVIALDYPKCINVTIVHPQIEIKTSEARKILGEQVNLEDAITQWSNVAGLICGLHTGDTALMGRSMNDVIVEPIRSALIPKYHEIKETVLKSGAFGCNIAGSGPAIFAFSTEKNIAHNLAEVMKGIYSNSGIDTITYVTTIGDKGVRVIG